MMIIMTLMANTLRALEEHSGEKACQPTFDSALGLDGLPKLAQSLGLPDAQSLINSSRVRRFRLGANVIKRSSKLISITLYSHREDKMIDLLEKEAFRDVYDLASRTTEGDLLDIGGHIGLTSLLFHKRHPDAQIYVFEPAPLSFFYLALNVIKNSAKPSKLKLFNRALSADGRGFLLEYSPDDTLSSRRASFGHSWGGAAKQYHMVQAVSMLQLKACLPLQQVGLVKLDCEGCEFDIVPSDQLFFSNSSRRLIGEFHQWHVTVRNHTGNVSLQAIKLVKSLLCHRERSDEDRIEWLRGQHTRPRKGC